MPEFKAASRKNFSTSGDLPTHADLKIGTLQRIADAAEAMAKTHIDLIAKRDYWERRALSAEKDLAACGRRNIALRGVITRMQNRVATPPALPELTRCASDRDGEPKKSGRHCPLDAGRER